MTDGLNPLSSLFSGGALSGGSNLFGPSPVNFGTTFDQAMAQAQTPEEKAKVAFVEAKFAQQSALAGIFSDGSSSLLSFGASSLFGTGGATGLPSWVYDAQRVLGNNPDIANMISMSEQASKLLQSQFNHSLSSLGESGKGFDSLF